MIGPITFDAKHAGERNAGNPPVAFDVAGAGNVAMAAGLRASAKALGNPPEPNAGAPVLDPTGTYARPTRRPGGEALDEPAAAAGGRGSAPPSSGNQTTLYLTPMHAEAGLIKSMIANVHAAIQPCQSLLRSSCPESTDGQPCWHTSASTSSVRSACQPRRRRSGTKIAAVFRLTGSGRHDRCSEDPTSTHTRSKGARQRQVGELAFRNAGFKRRPRHVRRGTGQSGFVAAPHWVVPTARARSAGSSGPASPTSAAPAAGCGPLLETGT